MRGQSPNDSEQEKLSTPTDCTSPAPTTLSPLFCAQVPAITPGAGYYLQLENVDEHHEGWQGHRIVGGVGKMEFHLIGRGVRTPSFTIVQAQPEVIERGFC